MQIIRTSQGEKLNALRACRYFSGLEQSILAELAEGTRLRRYERGEAIFWQDEPCHGLHILEKGMVKLFKISPQGREFIVNVFGEVATFAEVPVFDQGRMPVNAACVEPCDIWVVEAGTIRRVMDKCPELSKLVIYNLAQNLRMMVGIIEELSFYQVTHRLARLISQLTPEQLSGPESTRLTQDQLAARLGTVREVVARSLRELERSGAIRVDRRHIEVVDARVLEQWSQGIN
jgi:CRP/FNR family transcriptional regulator